MLLSCFCATPTPLAAPEHASHARRPCDHRSAHRLPCAARPARSQIAERFARIEQKGERGSQDGLMGAPRAR